MTIQNCNDYGRQCLTELQTVYMIIHRDLRRVARIRLVANAIAEAFERNGLVQRSGSARLARARN
jgi:hypothetical protein